jgi:hypothetical protein
MGDAVWRHWAEDGGAGAEVQDDDIVDLDNGASSPLEG